MDDLEIRELQTHLQALQRALRTHLPPVEGVSRSAVRVLGIVARAVEIQPGGIADESGMASSNVAAALRELDAAGLIARDRSLPDARRTTVTLTAAGAAAVAQHRALRVDGLRERIEVSLSPDEQGRLASVIPLLGRVVAAQPRRDS